MHTSSAAVHGEEKEAHWELQLVGETLKTGDFGRAGEGDGPQGSLSLGTQVARACLLWSLFEMDPHPWQGRENKNQAE